MTTISRGRLALRGIAATAACLLLVTTVVAEQPPRENGPRGRHPHGEPGAWQPGPDGGPGSRPGGPPPPGGRGLNPHALQLLDLTDEQFERVDELEHTMRRETRAIHKQLRQLDEQLRGLWRREQPDLTAIEAMIDEIGELHTRMAKRHAGFRVAVMGLLTAEQRTKAVELAD